MTTSVGRGLVSCIAVVAALSAALAGCSRDKPEGEGRLDPSGQVVLTRDGQAATVTESRALQSGDTLEVAEGDAKIALPGGDTLELRPRSVLVVNGGPDLRSGNLLVNAKDAPRTVRAAGSQIEALGTIRVDVMGAMRVVAYSGKAGIRSGGRTLEVPALREASIPVVGVLREPLPLAINREDPWDQRLLGEAAAKEPELESRARGFTAQVSPANASSVDYYRSLLPGLEREPAFQKAEVDRLGQAVVDNTVPTSASRFRAGDVLLGAAVALEGRRGTFSERLIGATAFRAEGASWALVAVDQEVPSIDGLLRLVDGAVNVAPLELAAPGPATEAVVLLEPPPARPTPTTRPAARQTTPTTRTSRAGAPTTSTTRPSPPPQQPPAEQARPSVLAPLDPLLDSTLDPVASLLNDLLNNRR